MSTSTAHGPGSSISTRSATARQASPTARRADAGSATTLAGAMRTRVTRSFAFEAAHQLPWHPGKCKRLHGHNYRFEVTVEGPLDEHGVVVDFDDLHRIVEAEVVDR